MARSGKPTLTQFRHRDLSHQPIGAAQDPSPCTVLGRGVNNSTASRFATLAWTVGEGEIIPRRRKEHRRVAISWWEQEKEEDDMYATSNTKFVDEASTKYQDAGAKNQRDVDYKLDSQRRTGRRLGV